MIRSLKLRQFAIIFAMTAVVVLGARASAQFITGRQMLLELHTEMPSSLIRCTKITDSTDALSQCMKQSFTHQLYKHFTGEFTLCQNAQAVGGWGEPSACAALADKTEFWSSDNLSTEPGVQMMVNTLSGQIWHVARLTQHPEVQLMMSEQSFRSFMKKLYGIRDNQMPVFVSLIFLAVMTMSHFLVNVTLGPLKNLKHSLSNLRPESLSNAQRITTPYREFDDFVTVYDELLKRLDDSFTKAKRFSADAAHELRTPLAILRGQAEDLIADVPTGSTMQIRLRSMADEIERLIEISEKLLLLSKADGKLIAHELSDFDLSYFLDELIEESGLYHPHLLITPIIEPHLNWFCNQALMQQLIHNLYSNAVKYNIPGGWIKLSLQRDGNMLEFSIENPASHIPADLSERAFDRFYRGDQARNRVIDGMGLGLSICKEIAKLHQGKLTLEVTQTETVVARLRVPLEISVIT